MIELASQFIQSLFSPISSIPHGVCLTWNPALVWTLAASHLLIGLSYFAIPLSLISFVRKQRDLRYYWMFELFGAFIFACGITHFIGLMNIWHPNYLLEAVMMAITAVISVATAASLIPMIPAVSRFLDEKAASEQQIAKMNLDLQDQMERFFDLAIAQRNSQAELMVVQDASPLGQFRTDAAGEVTYLNRTFEIISGWPAAAVMGSSWHQIIHPEDLQRVSQDWSAATRNQTTFSSRYRFRKPDGTVVWVSAKGAPVWVDGSVTGFVGSIDDITALHNAELALKAKQRQLEEIADALPVEVMYLHAAQQIGFANQALEERVGQPREQLEGQPLQAVLDAAEYQALKSALRRAMKGHTVIQEHEHGNGQIIQTTLIPAFDPVQNSVVGLHAMSQNITASKAEEKRLRSLSLTDALTGLGNRAGFEQALQAALQKAKRSPQEGGVAVIFADLDRLKHINDTFGHATGDALIKGFADRLKQGLRSNDYCARLGGDEFTAIMERVRSMDDVALFCEKLLQTLRHPFEIDGEKHVLTASFGVACHFADHPVSAANLLQKADTMLYAAKREGRNTFRIEPSG